MFAAIYLPKFQLQAVLRQEPGLRRQPVALVDAGKPVRVSQAGAAAWRAGVRPGMTSTQAQGRCPKLIFRTASPAQLASARDALWQIAATTSPWIEATEEGVCTLDLKSNLQPDYAPWAAALLAQLAGLHLKARIGIAPNPDLALLAARRTRAFLAVGDVTEFLRDLPIEALAPPAEIASIFKKCGIRTLGALSALPKQELPQRLGPEALALWDRAAGRASRLMKLVSPPETYEEAIDFEQEIETSEPLLFILRRFLEQLTARLDLAHLVVGELTMRLLFSSGPDYTRIFKIPAPTCRVETLFRMLHTHLENFTSEWPIAGVRLAATPARAANQQFGLFETALRDPNRFYETLAQISALVGAERIGTPLKRDTFRPDAFELKAVNFEPARVAEEAAVCGLALRRFRPPRPVQVFSLHHRPAHLVLDAASEPIAAVRGPWCHSGEWWDQEKWGRLEWDVQTARGVSYRIFRQEDRWFVDGVYD